MARFNTIGLDDIVKDLNREAVRAERLAPKMLEAGAKVIAKAQKRKAEEMIRSGRLRLHGNDSRSTGAFLASIKATPIRGSGAKAHVDIYPQGKDEKGVRNAEKGFLAEYGTSHMPSYPWMKIACEESAPESIEKMQEIWNKDD